MAIEMDAESLVALLALMTNMAYEDGKGVREEIERGEPDARTRQVLAVSAENDRLRGEVARLQVAIRRVLHELPQACWHGVIADLVRLLPPEQRDHGDEADCARDEP